MGAEGRSKKKRDRETLRDSATGLEIRVPAEPRRMTSYQAFIKAEQPGLKVKHPDLSQGQLISAAAEMWNSIVGKRRAPYDALAEKDLKDRMRDWDAAADSRETDRQTACRTLGAPSSTTWADLFAQVKLRNGDETAPVKRPKTAAVRQPKPQPPRQQQQQQPPPPPQRRPVERSSAVARPSTPTSSNGGAVKKETTASSAAVKSRSWKTCWQSASRRRAALKGLDAIFALASEGSNFDLFGNDVIQCFYDVANVTLDPVRARALMYVEQLAQRWRHSMVQRGWRNSRGGKPSPENILDAIIGVYCMERVGVSSARLKDDVQAALTGDEGAVLYGVADYLGFDPIAATALPEECTEILTGAKTTSKYRTLCNALIYSFYAERVGLSIGCTYGDVLGHLEELRPYKGPNQLEWHEYTDECYLVTHVVFTLNNWGELSLDPALLPHEYCFIREHLPVAVRERDIHLVGEFVECLRCFGATDADTLVQLGITFLLAAQSESSARWDEDADAYTSYHATMVASQALIVHSHFRGQGPGASSAVPVLTAWHANDVALPSPVRKQEERQPLPLKQAQPLSVVVPTIMSPKKQRVTTPTEAAKAQAPEKKKKPPTPTPRATPVVAPPAPAQAAATLLPEERASTRQTTRTNTAAAVENIEIRLKAAVETNQWVQASRLLREVAALPIDVAVLQQTTIGKTVASLKKSDDPKLKATAKAIVAKWKQLVLAGPPKEQAAPPAAPAAAPPPPAPKQQVDQPPPPPQEEAKAESSAQQQQYEDQAPATQPPADNPSPASDVLYQL